MSLFTVRNRAFTGKDYKYGNWSVKNRDIFYDGVLVASVRPRMTRFGIWLAVTTLEFEFDSDLVRKRLQTQAAIRKLTRHINLMTHYNGIRIEHNEREEW